MLFLFIHLFHGGNKNVKAFKRTFPAASPPPKPLNFMLLRKVFMQIGDYSLGQYIGKESHLIEISQLANKAFPKMFQGEKILRAPDVTFLGYSWKMVLGVINHRIYKLSVQFISDNARMADMTYSEAIKFCSKQYGTPSSGKDLPSSLRTLYERSGWTESEADRVMVWDTSFGNIIVDRRSVFDDHYVNFQAASGSLAKASHFLKTRKIRTVLAIILSAVAAYSFSFAIDLLLGRFFGVYPDTAFVAAFYPWSIISIAAFIGAVKITSLRGWLSIPVAVVGTLALLGALVGKHPHCFVVAATTLIMAAIIWWASRRDAQNS